MSHLQMAIFLISLLLVGRGLLEIKIYSLYWMFVQYVFLSHVPTVLHGFLCLRNIGIFSKNNPSISNTILLRILTIA